MRSPITLPIFIQINWKLYFLCWLDVLIGHSHDIQKIYVIFYSDQGYATNDNTKAGSHDTGAEQELS